jgi:hypothetical protein
VSFAFTKKNLELEHCWISAIRRAHAANEWWGNPEFSRLDIALQALIRNLFSPLSTRWHAGCDFSILESHERAGIESS